MNVTVSYQFVQDFLDSNQGSMSAAGAHGTLSGMLCRQADVQEDRWLSLVFADSDADRYLMGRDLFDELFEQTIRLLDDTDFGFDLFLPDDDAELSERAAALSEWCEGFLFGLGHGEQEASWPSGCEEVLKDIADIARLDTDAAGDAEEEAFTEICEFVRVGVQLVRGEFMELRRPRRLH
jgi:uncharacterized protein